MMGDFQLLLKETDCDLLFTTLSDDGILESVSNSVESMLGWQPSELCLQHAYQLPLPSSRRYFRRRRNGGYLMMERLVHKQQQGRHLLMERALRDYEDEDFTLFAGNCKTASEKMGVIEISQDGTILRWGIQELTNTSAETVLNRSLQDFVPAHEFQSLVRYLSKLHSYMNSADRSVEFRDHAIHLTFSGHSEKTSFLEVGLYILLDSIKFDSNCAVEEKKVSFVGVCSFSMEEYPHVDTAASFETYLKDFVENGSVGLHWVGADGIIKWANSADMRTVGCEKSEYIGKSITQFHADADVLGDLLQRLSRFEQIKEYPARLRHKDGSIRHVLIDSSVARNQNGEFLHTRCFTRDITTKVRLEEENRQREAEVQALMVREQAALEASRLKSEFLSTMSHEIRTPINGVIGMTSLLVDTQLNEQQRECVDTIQSSAELLLSIINDVLDLNKLEMGMVELENISFSVENTLRSIVRVVGFHAQKKQLPLLMECDPVLESAFHNGDPSRLQQVLLNFISNAIKFTAKGHVSVKCSQSNTTNDPAKIDTILFEVIDTGIGIADTSKLFKPFTQADASITRQYGGSGLGLNICKKLVELMDGKVGIESKLGTGTRIWAEIPLERVTVTNTSSQSDLTEKESLATSSDSNKINTAVRVLVAEDNIVNQKVLMRMLSRLGYDDVVLVENGEKAVAAVDEALESKYDFTIILMDCLMPVMGGNEACSIIRKKEKNRIGSSSHIPIVALTANATSKDEVECLAHGMDKFCTKPITVDRLRDVMNECLGRRKSSC